MGLGRLYSKGPFDLFIESVRLLPTVDVLKKKKSILFLCALVNVLFILQYDPILVADLMLGLQHSIQPKPTDNDEAANGHIQKVFNQLLMFRIVRKDLLYPTQPFACRHQVVISAY